MKPLFDKTVIYFPTLKKYGLGGGNLQAEYKYGKKLRSSILLTCKHIEVTKTPSKLKEHIEYGGCTELIIVGHGGRQQSKDSRTKSEALAGIPRPNMMLVN